jgi:hypothetical protein
MHRHLASGLLRGAQKAAPWILATFAGVIVGFAVGSATLRPPLRPECVKGSTEYDPKFKHCQPSASLWERTTEDPVAYFTFWLTGFTGVLACVGFGQGALINRQIQLGREEFNATHRPRLRVRNIDVRHVGGIDVCATDGKIEVPGIGEPLGGQFYVSNIGDAEARLREAHMMFYARSGPLPMSRPYEGQDGNLLVPKGWLAPGGSVPLIFSQPLICADRTTDTFIDPLQTDLYALGWIEYEDRAGNRRRTAFARAYNTGMWRFHPPQHASPDYESED